MIMHVNKACTTHSHNTGRKWFYICTTKMTQMIMHLNKACTTPSHNMGKKWFYDLQLSTEIFM